MNFNRPTMLMILDGFGINPNNKGNAIAMAKKPNLDSIFSKYPNTTLNACGLDVGLPKGQMGNSEVGHQNIGAGRIIYQDLTKITKSISDGDFFKNSALTKAMDHAKKNNSVLHLQGLLSNGGVHSHIDHLLALLDMAKKKGLTKVNVHCFLDGRDVPPKCALNYIKELEYYMEKIDLGQIASLSGRYYAMDRDSRWNRLEKTYDALTIGKGEKANNAAEGLSQAYDKNETDEFVIPVIVANNATVNDNDAIIMFNFRPDRAREITRAFVDKNFNNFNRKKVINNLCYTCMSQYDSKMPNVNVAYPPEYYKNTLGEYIASLGLKQLRIAETEKYAHVTFFFNGGIEKPNKNEKRILIPSPNVATYNMKPEMSAFLVTEKALEQINKNEFDVIILNFANADMVGHTGDINATIKAIETLDICVPEIIQAVLEKGGQLLLTADHGNADSMLDKNNSIITAHSMNPVPLINISKNPLPLKDGGKLADLSPTLLDMMNIEKPKEMTGNSLLKK